VAELLSLRGCRITILEALPVLAPQMARNNRTDLVLRLRAAGVAFHTKAKVLRRSGERVECIVDGTPLTAAAEIVVAAIGAIANRDILAAVEAAGVPCTIIGDANVPGDFLSVLRDSSMAGLAIGLPHERLPA
jgi:pyruvate/2-oxoglutarate dehydrogenase complex dihydrolipoamide dehydrogenase (E3) component